VDTPTNNGVFLPGSEVKPQKTKGRERRAGRARDTWDTDLLERVELLAAGHTARALARRLKIHPETTRRYLRGDRPSARFIARLCTAFGVSADWLLNGHEPRQRPDLPPAKDPDAANPAKLRRARRSPRRTASPNG
jgi:transcriptional regulator with XRE-family HTH domain